jgi:serine/threonine protein kinase
MGCGKSTNNDASNVSRKSNVNGSSVQSLIDSSRLSGKPSLPQALQRDITLDYTFGQSLGKGHFGIVRSGRSRTNSTMDFAIKTITKEKVKAKDVSYLKQEVAILSSLDHPNIVKLYDVYEDSRYLHLVMEFCSGGELFDRIINVGRYTEA